MLIIRFIVLLVLNSSFGTSFIYADNCSTISGSTETISTNCGPLEISGDGSNVTINSGITIENENTTVKTPNATNAVITNNGAIKTTNGNSALRNTLPGNISDLTNNGLIISTANDGIRNGGSIDNLTNSGEISANRYGIRNFAGTGRLIGTLTNSGEISAIDHSGIKNDGIIETLNNSGEIKAKNQGIWTKGTINTLTNSGTISAENDHAIKAVPGSTIGILTNSGTISAGDDFAIRNDESNSKSNIISMISNSGIISASRNGIWNDATITSLTNSGTIRAINHDFAIKNVGGVIGSLTNSGSITAGRDWAIYNTGTINYILNTGTISASNNNIGIYNDGGIIKTLDNSQSDLTYKGALPTNYNAIINSPSNYGKITFSDVSGATNFGVHSSSTLAVGTYGSVTSGLTSGDITSGTSGKHSNSYACTDVIGTTATFTANCADLDISGDNANVTINSGVTISGEGDLDWELDNSSGTLWDLVVTDELHEIVNTGTNTSLTNLGIIAALEDGSNGIHNQGSFKALINDGIISAGEDNGINNTGTINYILNTGTISASNNNIGIYNDGGIIKTLDNSQSDLTYKGALPTNYNAIINSPSNYGKITFSDVSGATNFGVHSSSTLAVGTYGSVTSGLTSGDITSGTSGKHSNSYACTDVIGTTATFTANCADLDISGDNANVTINSGVTISGEGDLDWELDNSSGTLWDLVVTDELHEIVNTGTNTSLTNLGIIAALEDGSNGIHNQGSFKALINDGIISTDNYVGIFNNTSATITNLTNSGVISSVKSSSLYNIGTISSLENSGTISAGEDNGINNEGIIGNISNTGTISAGNYVGIFNNTSATITNLTNSGVISSVKSSSLYNIGTISSLENSGTISAGEDNGINNEGIIGNISNTGTISAGNYVGIFNNTSATITNLTNSGVISSVKSSSLYNIGTISSLENSGTISAGEDNGINNTGTINYILNTGTISASNNNIGIYNDGGIIKTLDNSQSDLTYKGALPTNYNAIINSPSNYGKITFSDVSGATNFGVHSSSTLAVGTYGAVMSGLNANNISSGTSGTVASPNACTDVIGTTATFTANCADLDISGDNANVTINSGVTISGEGDLDWELDNSSGTLWDLVVTAQQDFVNTGNNTSFFNAGHVSGSTTNGIHNQGSFETLINSGIITSNGKSGIFNNTSATITNLTNSGVISSVKSSSLYNIGTISSLENSGTISAGEDNGINNTGTINYILNTGTISASNNNIGIYNDGGIIKTLDNSQSDLTYKGALPTNYNAIINSPSNYGKITFSDVSGATNFGVHSSSTLAVGTYGAVMSGLNANNISSGTSGTFVSGADRIKWILENVDSNWNLIISDKIDIAPDTFKSIETSVKSNTIDSFNDLNSVIEVNFANMNTYDCDSFGSRNGCISLGGRDTQINNPKTRTKAIVLIGGYKLSDSIRVAGFYHRNYEHATPKNFKLSDKTPLLGGLIVWNQFSNGLGLQIKLATAFQKKHATLIREVVGSSEEGRAKTEIGTKSRVIEFQQGYRYNDDIILRPYLAFRRATSRQDAYTETGIASPLSFNAIRDEMITALFGLKFNIARLGDLPDALSFRGSLGMEYDLSHSVSKIQAKGISGLAAVSLTESFNEKRPVASVGFDYEIKLNRKFSGTTQYQELPYENKNETNYYLYFTQGF